MHRTKFLMRNDFILAFLIHESNSYHANLFFFIIIESYCIKHKRAHVTQKLKVKSVSFPYDKNGYNHIGISEGAKSHKYFDNRSENLICYVE